MVTMGGNANAAIRKDMLIILSEQEKEVKKVMQSIQSRRNKEQKRRIYLNPVGMALGFLALFVMNYTGVGIQFWSL